MVSSIPDPPIGTGPFKFVEYQRDAKLVYRNDNYWDTGKPIWMDWNITSSPKRLSARYSSRGETFTG
jgi:ABC-type transport system substrate-binding protein